MPATSIVTEPSLKKRPLAAKCKKFGGTDDNRSAV